jgi:hypothetical protein
MTAILGGCTAIAEESIHSPLCPPEEVSTGMCINNPQSPCCDPGED